jgi:CxxC motif-containing protein (DUF1111 family)
LPLFGDGLIELVPDRVLRDNLASNASAKAALRIKGKISAAGRFGRKAQRNSLSKFAAAGFINELGVSSDIEPTEAIDDPTCQGATIPNLTPNFTAGTPAQGLADHEKVATYFRFLAAPVPSTSVPGGAESIARGRQAFGEIGCALCHTPKLRTAETTVAALSNKEFEPFTDLALHNMGSGLSDFMVQEDASGEEWKTTPLWGVGQRIFLLHDGRTTDMQEAIKAHKSPGSEGSAVVDKFNALSEGDKQNLLNFLRSL